MSSSQGDIMIYFDTYIDIPERNEESENPPE